MISMVDSKNTFYLLARVYKATGMHASEDVQTSILGVVEKGKKEFEKFVDFRLLTDAEPTHSYKPITHHNRLTFSDMTKKTGVVKQGKAIKIAINSELVFRHALALSKQRPEVDLLLLLYQLHCTKRI